MSFNFSIGGGSGSSSGGGGGGGTSMFTFEIVDGDLIMHYQDGTTPPNIFIRGTDLIMEID